MLLDSSINNITIPLVLTSFTPTVIGPQGGAIVTLTGTGFPILNYPNFALKIGTYNVTQY